MSNPSVLDVHTFLKKLDPLPIGICKSSTQKKMSAAVSPDPRRCKLLYVKFWYFRIEFSRKVLAVGPDSLIGYNIIFSISATRVTENCRQN